MLRIAAREISRSGAPMSLSMCSFMSAMASIARTSRLRALLSRKSASKAPAARNALPNSETRRSLRERDRITEGWEG